MPTNILSNKVVRDVAVTLAGLVAVLIILQGVLGVANPFYVVSSGSMIPELEINDIIVIQGKSSIEDVKVGEIIVFDRPSDHERVIVHRVESITGENPTVLRTKGDANAASIPGTDYPITSEEYIGTVILTVPQVGYVTKVFSPPTNYIIMAIIISIMVAKHFLGKKSENKKDTSFEYSKDTDVESAEPKPDLDHSLDRAAEEFETKPDRSLDEKSDAGKS